MKNVQSGATQYSWSNEIPSDFPMAAVNTICDTHLNVEKRRKFPVHKMTGELGLISFDITHCHLKPHRDAQTSCLN